MRIDEVAGLKTFIATVRVKNGSNVTTTKTPIQADGQMQARAIMTRIFGEGNVLAVLETSQMTEMEGGTKTLSAAELRVKSLADQAKRLKQQEKELKARNALKKAQLGMAKLVEWADAPNADISNASI